MRRAEVTPWAALPFWPRGVCAAEQGMFFKVLSLKG